MSEYQYYEFCRLDTPLSQETRREMAALSSRARVGTHGASYVYNCGDFRGDPEKLVLKYFNVFFYISNFGTFRLLFKYPLQQINLDEIKKYCIQNVISAKVHGEDVLLDICIFSEEAFGWIEGENLLADLLPLYDEIKIGEYQFLRLVSAIEDEWTNETQNAVSAIITKMPLLSSAQEAFLNCVGIERGN